MKTVRGTLRQTGGGRYDWFPAGREDPVAGICDCKHERSIEIIENVDLDVPQHPPCGRVIDVVFEGSTIIRWDFSPVPAKRKGYDKDIALAIIRKPGDITDDLRGKVDLAAAQIEHYIRLTNDEDAFTGIRVTPYIIETELPAQLLFPWYRVKDLMEEQHPGRYEHHTYFHAWGGYKPGTLGEAYVNSRMGITYSNGRIDTIWHELVGHQFGCNHSKKGRDEYGHNACIMGRGPAGLCASQLINLGVIPESEIEPLENNSVGFLAPAEASKVDLRNGETRAIRLSSMNIILSTRKAGDQSYLGYDEEGLMYVEMVGTVSYAYPELRAMIRPGHSQEIEGITIHNDGHQEGVVRVRLGRPSSVPDYPQSQPPVPGEAFVNDHSGVWADPRFIHQGLNILTIPEQENRIVAHWFTFRAPRRIGSNQSTLFFVLDAVYNTETGVYDSKIYDVSTGESVPVGWARLRLKDGELMMRYYCEYFGRGHMVLEQTTTAREDPQGVYDSKNFSGYSVGKFIGTGDDGSKYDVYTAYWFSRGPRPSDLQWVAYQGTDINELVGYKMDSRFESEIVREVDRVDPIDLEEITRDYPRIDKE